MKEIILKDALETLYYDECENGLPIYMWPKKNVNGFYITLTVKYGSIHTKFRINNKKKICEVPGGSAHYLEHVKFNEKDGTTAHEYFAKLGSYINAYTTFENTTYQVFASNNFNDNLNHLLDYVTTPVITKKLVNKERGIILEEANMGKDNPYQDFQFTFFKNIFKNLPYRNLVIGENEEIKKITAEDLQLIFDTFYHPKNMFIVITGNFNPYEASALIKENQKNKAFVEYKNPEIIKEKEPEKVLKKYEEIKKRIGESKIKIGIKIPRNKFKEKDDIKLNIMLNLIRRINFGATSEFKYDLLEKELITSLNTSIFNREGIILFQVSAETKYPEEVTKLIKEKLFKLEVDDNTLKRIIKANIANIVLDYDDIELVNDNICDMLIEHNKIITSYKDIYSTITKEKIEDVIKSLDSKNISIVHMVPED